MKALLCVAAAGLVVGVASAASPRTIDRVAVLVGNTNVLVVDLKGNVLERRQKTKADRQRGDEQVPAWLRRARPGKIGHWRWADRSPDGRTLLAQWSAECEIPVAYFADVTRRTLKPVARKDVESVAVGWARDGRAVVHFLRGACAAGVPRAGIYLVARTGVKQLVYAVPQRTAWPLAP